MAAMDSPSDRRPPEHRPEHESARVETTALQLLEQWLAEPDSGSEGTVEDLKRWLDADRAPNNKLFP